MHIHKKYLKTAGIISLIFLILLIGALIAYNKRDALLRSAIAKVIHKAKADYNLNVSIQKAGFTGLKTVYLDNISVIPENRDTLASVSGLQVTVKLFPMLFGKIKLERLNLNDGLVKLVKRDSLRNYDFLFRKKSPGAAMQDTVTEVKPKARLDVLANNLINRVLDKIPDDMQIRNFDLKVISGKDSLNFYTTSATINGGDLKSTILVNNTESVWHIDGKVNPARKQLDVKLYAESKKVALPLLKKKYNLELNFDTIQTDLNKVSRDEDGLRLSGSWSVKNLLINHPKIAANDIIVPEGSINADMIIGPDFIALDSTSVIHLKKISANPYIKYTLSPHKTIALKLHTPQMQAQQLFDSFPIGLFESLEGIQVAGQLQYDLRFFLDTTNPDAVQFDSRLNKKDFRIVKWGKTNLSRINGTFIYTPYENGRPMRNIVIGPANPDYTPIEQISPNLKNAVLTAEDPSFYTHHGFVEESIRKSIATDFKQKSFARGGSTISMQLVKNVFLNRQKTLSRKIEEILIVWLMENTHVSTKQRMFEVYLNLIEWGRNVYGIGEASRYYFGKHPSELTEGEGIFLASIVPRPKQGLYFFEPDGSLRTGLHGYFNLIGNLMAKRGWAEPDTNAYGFYTVRLKESLRRQIAPADTVITDSLDFNEPEDENFLQQIFGHRSSPDTGKINSADKRKGKTDTVKPSGSQQQKKEEKRKKKKKGFLNIF